MENAEWKMESYANRQSCVVGSGMPPRRSAYDSYRLTIKR